MSRLGKKPILVPAGTEVKTDGLFVSVKGPQGTLSRKMPQTIEVVVKDGTVMLAPKSSGGNSSAMWGTWVSHIKNMIEGVNKGFEKKLLIEGVGYKVDVKGNDVILSVGFSHTVTMPIPEGIKVVSDKTGVKVSGTDIEKVGDFTAKMRAVKKPEPYKGKGIRYAGEYIRRKAGKSAGK
jgi:large subunit ribosomal protein L6